MIEINIPGRKNLKLKNIVFDYNGTIALDGVVPKSVKDMILSISECLNVYVITADTYGNAKTECEGLPINLETFPNGKATQYKKEFVEKIGAEDTMAVGNGLNDVEMFKVAGLSIAVIGEEGCSSQAIMYSHITVNHINRVFDMIMKKDRIKATLRD